MLRRIKNSSGYTMVEMILYMSIAVVIIGFASSMTGHISKMYTHERRVSTVQTTGRNAIYFLRRDIVNTGYKIRLTDSLTPGIFKLDTVRLGTINLFVGDSTKDSIASFRFFPGNPFDTLEILKMNVNDTGLIDSVVRIEFVVKDGDIYRVKRSFRMSDSSWINPDTLITASNIEALQYSFSSDKINFSPTLTDSSKRKVKAIKIELLAKTTGITQVKAQQSFRLADITLNYNDKFVRRKYGEVVEVVNNGE